MSKAEISALVGNKAAMKAIKLIDRAASACHFGELTDKELCADIEAFRSELAAMVEDDTGS
ncbi:hypothetical protein [Halomonas sp. MS1]|nr:hypothetical protein [Halomonas sp. MS1]UTD55951.1 hypothetical protein NF683_01650 [Halomonas sp. MS1]